MPMLMATRLLLAAAAQPPQSEQASSRLDNIEEVDVRTNRCAHRPPHPSTRPSG